ncbi:unnamed protein product, partial [Amoebophrya sp. A25]|eukprot:GSA25T00024313001.1
MNLDRLSVRNLTLWFSGKQDEEENRLPTHLQFEPQAQEPPSSSSSCRQEQDRRTSNYPSIPPLEQEEQQEPEGAVHLDTEDGIVDVEEQEKVKDNFERTAGVEQEQEQLGKEVVVLGVSSGVSSLVVPCAEGDHVPPSSSKNFL